MTKFLEIQYILALWFYKTKQEISDIQEISNYKNTLQMKLINTDYILLFSTKDLDDCMREYSNCFELIDYHIRRKVSLEYLISRFISYIPTEILEKIV